MLITCCEINKMQNEVKEQYITLPLERKNEGEKIEK